jgi:pimeloyl-ACP methyl ester carboxylesterase
MAIAGFSATAHAVEAIASRTVDVEGVKFHYLTAGHAAPVLLLHGYVETSLMWKPLIPALAGRFTVIAPDLPGIGDSSIPASGHRRPPRRD